MMTQRLGSYSYRRYALSRFYEQPILRSGPEERLFSPIWRELFVALTRPPNTIAVRAEKTMSVWEMWSRWGTNRFVPSLVNDSATLEYETIALETLGPNLYHEVVLAQATHLDAMDAYKVSGYMYNQGVITEAGLRAFAENQTIAGHIAVKSTIIAESCIRFDIMIVDDIGNTLAVWEGVELMDGAQVTWLFGDQGQQLNVSFDPIVTES